MRKQTPNQYWPFQTLSGSNILRWVYTFYIHQCNNIQFLASLRVMKFFIIQIEIDAFKLYYLHFVHLSHRNILLVGWFNHKKEEKIRSVWF